MSKIVVLVIVLLVILGLAVYNLSAAPTVPEIHVFTWADYISSDVVAEFEAKHNCKVVIDNFESNEAMYAKLKAGAVGYDVLMPSSYMAKSLYMQKMIIPLNHDLLPNLKNLDSNIITFVTTDAKSEYSVPYMLTLTGIGYSKSELKDIQPSWGMFDRQDLRGKITLLNDIRETLGAALKYCGYSVNTRDMKELEKARDVVIGWKKNVAKFAVEDSKMGLGSGEFIMAHQYSGDVRQVMKEDDDIDFMLPKEGFCISSDDMVIPTTAKQVELAHKFINFLLDPRVCAKNMEMLGYIAPNTEAQKFVNQEFADYIKRYLNPEILKNAEVIQDVGEDLAKFNKVWNDVRSAE